MVFDRVMVAAQKFNQTTGEPWYSGQAAMEFRQKNKGMFNAMAEADPTVAQTLDQQINGLVAMDKIRARPDVAGLPKDLASAATVQGAGPVAKVLGSAGPTLARMAGAELGRRMETGTIQIPGIMAEQGAKAYEGLYQHFTGNEAPHVQAMNNLREAMFDPSRTQAYLDALNAELKAGQTPTLATVARGVAQGHRAAQGAAALSFNYAPGTFSPSKPWVRSAGVEAATSVDNSDQTTPPIQHRYPVTPPLRPGAKTPWDR